MAKRDYGVRSVPRTFELVAKQIADYMSEEQLKKGDKLPAERKLCELLEVSRSSVREGLRVLELLRYLDSRQGGGTFVDEVPPYLLPPALLNQKVDSENLRHYFEVALTTAEKIILSSFGDSIDPEDITEQEFWEGFSDLVSHLGARLENPHYVTLWSDTYELLQDNHFFENVKVPFSLDAMLKVFLEENQPKLIEMLGALAKGNNR